MRIFLAVFPSGAARSAAAAVIDRLRGAESRVSWVRRDNLHYTVRFMGELGDKGLERVIAAAREGVNGQRRFDAVLGAAGAFPSARKARVLWLGLAAGGEALTALARAIEAALRRRGFDPADKPFKAHLTLGRVRDREQDWSGRLDGVSAAAERFVVDRVSIVQSTLSSTGSRYEIRADAELAS